MEQGLSAFDSAYGRLNEAQKKAVDTIEGPVMVIAGPGTGKTQILTLRIANILKRTDTPPDAILALTFTNSGVRAMRERLATFIGNDAYRVGIYTFHGYAAQAIERHPSYFPRIIGARAADDVDLYDVVRAALFEVGDDALLPAGNREYYVKPVLKLIGTLKSDACTVADYASYIETITEEEPSGKLIRSKAFVQVYDAYERLLRSRGLYDYNDMLLELIGALRRDREFRLMLSESAQYILADEHQDANRAQNHILELLAEGVGDRPNIFIVGDEKQAIYRFQGASLENFLYFKERYGTAELIPLSENYRSTIPILEHAGKLIEGHTHFDAMLRSTKGEGERVTILSAKTKEQEVTAVADEIAALSKKGVPLSEIAVLVRANSDIDLFARAFRARALSATTVRDTDALSLPEVQLVLSLIRVAIDPYDDEALSRTLFLPSFRISMDDVTRLLHERAVRRTPLYDLMLEEVAFRPLRALIERLEKVAHTRPALEALDEVVRETGFLAEVLSADEMPNALAAYRAFHTLIGTRTKGDARTTLAGLAPLVQDLMRGVAPIPYMPLRGEGVCLMTLHKAKGLEFDYVFMPHALESRFGARTDRSLFHIPPSVNVPDPDEADERRLFYVGMTRARKRLVISRHDIREDEKEERPAVFLSALDEVEEVCVDMTEPIRPAPSSMHTSEAYTHIIEEFLSRGISATALNAYLRDPWTCFIESILRMPHAEAPHQAYGSAIHAALEHFFSGFKDGSASKETLVSAFERELKKRPLQKRDYDTFLTRGEKALRGYADEYAGTFTKDVETEVSVVGELTLPSGHTCEKVTLRGFLDKVEMLKGGNVRVVDYKTGTPKSRNEIEGKTKAGDGSYKRQLVFYALLLAIEGKRNMQEAIIDFVEPNQRGIYKREVFVVTPGEVEELKAQIADMVDGLMRGDFLSEESISDDPQISAFTTILRERFLNKNTR